MIVSELRPGMTFVSSGGSLSELIVAVDNSDEHTFSVYTSHNSYGLQQRRNLHRTRNIHLQT